MQQQFENRREAGRLLADALSEYAGRGDVVVLGLPRGGVPVAFEIATALDAPLDVFIVRKLGMPGHEEYGIGAIASGGVRVLDEDVLRSYGIDGATLERITARERRELERREKLYRDDRPFPDLHGRVVILVDDGLATGSTMSAAVAALRAEHPREIVVAVPVGAPERCDALSREVDRMLCLRTPEPFYAVGLWYRDFDQTTDEEVHDLLERAAARMAEHR
ncbi:MAG TPA: phosphoribosyltransferase [Gemmatimonadaceae bacterium]|nr:phosphoribosyltransferase [Gemmatimonadaceae bacterium]